MSKKIEVQIQRLVPDVELPSYAYKGDAGLDLRSSDLDDGTSYAASYGSSRSHEPHYDARIWGLATDRQRLYDRIDAR
ncbi:MAG: hypothetical protein PHR15_08415, partial [Atopobiaceae bacterium]|nr:hypothetical protein [Atopobiaceae bacterium]